MQPIERYGLIALIFLAITITAAYVWGSADPAEASGPMASNEPEETAPRRQRPDWEHLAGRSTPRAGRGLQPRTEGELVSLADRRADNRPTVRGDEIEPAAERDLPGRLADTAEEVLGGALEKAREVAEAILPEPEPAREPAPKDRRRENLYVIQPGDTLSEIAERELGRTARWQEIVALNPGLDEHRLREGARIVLPAAEGGRTPTGPAAREEAPRDKPPAGAPTYVVQPDDSMWRIAASQLGDGARWKEIADLNPDVDADRIVAGQTLVLPAGAKPKPRVESPARPERVAQAQPRRGAVR